MLSETGSIKYLLITVLQKSWNTYIKKNDALRKIMLLRKMKRQAPD